MRISSDQNDPDYISNTSEFIIYCDGIELKSCFTADTDLDMALCYEDNGSGGFLADPLHPHNPKVIEIHGSISIAIRDE